MLLCHKFVSISSEIFGAAECEIIHSVNCEISHFVRCEMKFAFSHLRSKYFTAELFHMAEPYFTRRRRISLKKAHICPVDKCVLFSGGERGIRTLVRVLAETRFPVVRLRPAQPSLLASVSNRHFSSDLVTSILYTKFFFLSRGF